MNLKQLFINSIIGIFVLFSTPVYAYALTTAVPPQGMKYEVNNPTLVGSNSGNVRANPVRNSSTLQQRALAEIQRRITALNGLITRIKNFKHLSDSQKTTFTTQVETEIANLTALQTKIQGDTDPTTLKTDVQSIVTSFRIFALFMPQMRFLAAADSVLDVSDKMSTLSGSLQTRITAASSAGQNVTTLQTLLSDIELKITDAKLQANTIIKNVSLLTPEGYPGNKTTLETARTQLQTAIGDLKNAKNDARQIIIALMTNGNSTSQTSTNSALPNTLAPLVPKQGVGTNPAAPQGTTQEAPSSNSGNNL